MRAYLLKLWHASAPARGLCFYNRSATATWLNGHHRRRTGTLGKEYGRGVGPRNCSKPNSNSQRGSASSHAGPSSKHGAECRTRLKCRCGRDDAAATSHAAQAQEAAAARAHVADAANLRVLRHLVGRLLLHPQHPRLRVQRCACMLPCMGLQLPGLPLLGVACKALWRHASMHDRALPRSGMNSLSKETSKS